MCQIISLTYKNSYFRGQQTIIPLIEISLESNDSQIVSTSFKTQLKSNFRQLKDASVLLVSMTLVACSFLQAITNLIIANQK
ncbi:MAG: hypothetical protein ACI9JR_002177 [Gammaproteobacteria bacterium]|jgi:hypothetical protein